MKSSYLNQWFLTEHLMTFRKIGSLWRAVQEVGNKSGVCCVTPKIYYMMIHTLKRIRGAQIAKGWKPMIKT